MRVRKTLPNKPSALIRLALRDLIATEKSGIDDIDMSTWCEKIDPFSLWDPTPKETAILEARVAKGGCVVCFAGAVMRRSLGARVNGQTEFSPNDFPKFVDHLEALNDFRCGYIDGGLSYMGIETDNPDLETARTIVQYDENSDLFKQQMEQLAADFERAGL